MQAKVLSYHPWRWAESPVSKREASKGSWRYVATFHIFHAGDIKHQGSCQRLMVLRSLSESEQQAVYSRLSKAPLEVGKVSQCLNVSGPTAGFPFLCLTWQDKGFMSLLTQACPASQGCAHEDAWAVQGRGTAAQWSPLLNPSRQVAIHQPPHLEGSPGSTIPAPSWLARTCTPRPRLLCQRQAVIIIFNGLGPPCPPTRCPMCLPRGYWR